MLDQLSRSLVAAVLVSVLATGCQNGEPESPEPASEPEGPPTNEVTEEDPMSMETPENPSLDEAVNLARGDLAKRLGVAPEDIEVTDAREVTWPNGALGCPEDGGMYTQALVDGFYIQLQAEGTRHAYHAGRDGVPFACPADRSEPPRNRSAPTS